MRLNAHAADIDYRARRGLHKDTVAQLAKTELLIIDDWGLDVLTQQQRNDMLEMMEDRHAHHQPASHYALA